MSAVAPQERNQEQQRLIQQAWDQLQAKREQRLLRQDKSMAQLVEATTEISKESLEIFMQPQHQALVSSDELQEMQKAFSRVIDLLNRFPKVKRFYVLETMDLFRTKLSLAKLIPPLLLLEGEAQKKAIAEFVKPTFLSINKNVETLTGVAEIFHPQKIHLERGSLYTFVSDLAKVITKMFDPPYLDSFSEVNSPVDLALQLMESNPYFLQDLPPETPGPGMLQDAKELRARMLEFATVIQSHEALYNYSLKRHDYYKLFLRKLTEPGRFKGLDPYAVSMVLAEGLVSNNQLTPPPTLINAMSDEAQFDVEDTLRLRSRFIDELSPSTVYQVILQVKDNLQKLMHQDFRKEFGVLQRLNVKNLLKGIWKSFLNFGERIARFAAAPFQLVFEAAKAVYKSVLSSEAEPDDASSSLAEPVPTYLAKLSYSLKLVGSRYNMVSTDVTSFRGEYEGASQKDYNYNFAIFDQNEEVQNAVKHALERLFRSLQQNEHVKIFSLPENRQLKETYLAFTFGPYLLGLGLTLLKGSTPPTGEARLFPYLLLFEKGEDKTFGRTLSRKVLATNKLYNELAFTPARAVVFYESLLHILHLLPDADWEQEETQKALLFLQAKLRAAWEQKPRLLFLEGPP